MVIVGAVVAVLDALLIMSGSSMSEQLLLLLVMMWTPGLVAIVLRLARREGFADV